MVAAPHSDRLTSLPGSRALTRRWNLAVRRFREAEVTWVLLLGLLTLLIGAAMLAFPLAVPVSVLIVPAVIANLMLSPRSLPWFVVFVLSVVVVVVAINADVRLDRLRIVGVLNVFVVGLIILVASFRRSRLGVAGARGESMLVDLRDRISKQAQIPSLPPTWYSEAVMRSAGGSSFAGDFMVAARTEDGDRLEVAVVDVSGKGEQAGTRSRLLSGAFGGLLAALPSSGFLPAANDYLLRQDWPEGFATAVHLSLDLVTGRFEVRSAGHPPMVQLHAGSGRWGVHQADGPVLGLMRDAEFTVVTGTVQRGDALLLFTDGLVETPQRDISLGIDKLLGQGERLLQAGFERGARRLIDQLESMNDDRALLLLHRR
ncbi:MAG: PP2C family protein-serine/threonine phosphatase [Nocardioidaceae bacterium]